MKRNSGTIHNNSNSSSMSSKKLSRKFVKQSFYRRFIKVFTDLIAYLYSVMPLYRFVHECVSVIRLAQLLSLSYFGGNRSIWEFNSVEYKLVNFFSVLIRPWPYDTSFKSYCIFGWISLAISVILVPAEFAMGYVYKKKGTLSKETVIIWNIYTSTIEFILYPMMGSMIGALMGYMFEDKENYATPYYSVLLILMLAVMILNISFYILLNTARLSFIPNSLATLHHNSQAVFTIIVIVATCFAEISPHTKKTGQIIMMALVFIVLLNLNVVAFYRGVFLDDYITLMYITFLVDSQTNIIICIVCRALDRKVSAWIFVVDCLLPIVVMAIFIFYLYRLHNRLLIQLDGYMEDPEMIHKLNNYYHFSKMVLAGFKCNHPYVISFSFFRDFIQAHPGNVNALILFAKFISMYPEESTQLQWIYISLKNNKEKSIKYKSVMKQIQMILMKRDPSLRPELKREIESCHQLITTAKLRLRAIWEVVLEGTSRDLGSYFARFQQPLNELDRIFSYFQIYHPNSPFAARACAIIARDVMCDPQLASEMKRQADILQRGQILNSDCVQIAAFIQFPCIPHRSQSKLGQTSSDTIITLSDDMMSSSTSHNQLDQDIESGTDDNEIITHIKELISHVKSPSIIKMRVFIVISVLLFSIIPLWLMPIIFKVVDGSILTPASFISFASEIAMLQQITEALSFRVILERLGAADSECNQDIFSINNISGLYNGSCRSEDYLLHFSKKILDVSKNYEVLMIYENDRILNKMYDLYFNNVNVNVEYSSNVTKESQLTNGHQLLIDFCNRAIKIAEHDDDIWDTIGTGIFGAISTNGDTLKNVMGNMSSFALQYVYLQSNYFEKVATYTLIGVGIFSLVLFIFFVVYVVPLIVNNEKVAYDCFSSLPKSTISRIIEKLDTSHKSCSITEEESTNLDFSKQREEQKAIAILRSGNTSKFNKIHFRLYIYFFFFIIQLLADMAIIYTHFSQVSNLFADTYPQLFYISDSFTDILTSIVLIFKQTAIDSGYTDQISEWKTDIDNNLIYYLRNGTAKYRIWNFGDVDVNIPSFSTYGAEVLTKFDEIKCIRSGYMNLDDHSLYSCYPYDSVFQLLIQYLERINMVYINNKIKIETKYGEFPQIMHMIVHHLYPMFFGPLYNTFSDYISTFPNIATDQYIIFAVILTLYSLIMMIIGLIILSVLNTHIRSMLKCLLYVPSSVIVQSSKIMKVLNGDFSMKGDEIDQTDWQMYDQLLEKFSDAIIICNKKSEIVRANDVARKILGNELTSIPSEFLVDSKHIPFRNEYHLRTFNFPINDFETVVVLMDIGHLFELEKQIKDENVLLESVLLSIMPKQAVSIKMNDTLSKGVSFLVPSVSVMSICMKSAINTESYKKVTTILRNLAKNRPTIDSIECFGDYFIVVAGIFAEVNIAEAHAREISDCAVEVSQFLRKEVGDTLQDQIGIATGGPVVCCVLELNRPVFEIFGMPIELSQEMALFANTGAVHITRSVYELIYGGKHSIRERGEVQLLKYGKTVTYIIPTITQ